MIKSKSTTTLNKEALINLKNNLKFFSSHHAELGVFSGTEKKGTNVVDVAKIHEFGNPAHNIPQRSFLRLPIQKKQKEIKKTLADVFDKLKLQKNGSFKTLQTIAIKAQAYSMEAFRTRGWNTWKFLTRKTILRKNSTAILIDSGELRRNIRGIVSKNK